MFKIVPNVEIPILKSVDESKCKSFAEFYFFFFFGLKVLTLGSGLFLEGRLDSIHQQLDIRTRKRPSFEEQVYLVLMNLCLAFFWVLISQFFFNIYRSRNKCLISLHARWLKAYRSINKTLISV